MYNAYKKERGIVKLNTPDNMGQDMGSMMKLPNK